MLLANFLLFQSSNVRFVTNFVFRQLKGLANRETRGIALNDRLNEVDMRDALQKWKFAAFIRLRKLFESM